MHTRTGQYTDGNGNEYAIGTISLVYTPVKLHESSSGFYSGGQPRQVTLTAAQQHRLIHLLEVACNKSESHSTNRAKGSGLIQLFTTTQKTSVILTPGCAEQKYIEVELKQFLT
jgi:hypothetical protein